MSPQPGPVYFADENTLGLGKLLQRSGRVDVRYPGHEDLPEIPLGTADLDWMPVVARLDFVVLTRDKHIRTRQPSYGSTASMASDRCGWGRSKISDRRIN
ncbi:hypothetical protein [Flexivirga alba]|uniref:VapC45 PIN like domain-containing protein n=1 Tax=Flexivirga alba TaxID=702742 RepID=A0ABW2AG64_9MICO